MRGLASEQSGNSNGHHGCACMHLHRGNNANHFRDSSDHDLSHRAKFAFESSL
jgi:hypothetical protein